MKTGQYVIVIGLLVQILWFGGFIFVAGVFPLSYAGGPLP